MRSIILLFLTFICVTNASARERVDLFLKWKHQFQFAGFYVAKELGYYEAEGLDVNIVERELGVSHIDKVSEGPGRYGISDSSIVIKYLEGSEFLVVAPIFQHSPLVLATLKKNNFWSPLELKGKKVMYQKNVDDAIIAAMFHSLSLSRDDIISIDHNFKLDDLISGKVDATSIYTTNQPYDLDRMGIQYHLIYPENYGIDLYGDMIFTTKEEAIENPDRVRAFRRASLKGWRYTFDEFEKSLKIVQKYSKTDLEKLRFEGKATEKMILPNTIDIGTPSVHRFYRIAKIYNPNDKNISEKNIENVLFDNFIENRSWKKMAMRWLMPVSLIVALIILFQLYYTRRLAIMVKKRTLELEKANEVKDLFFHNITHELRTPLNGIICGADSLRRENLSSENLDLLEMISYSGKTLLHIVNDILDFSKIQRKKFELKNRAFNFCETVENLTHFYEKFADKKGLKFVVDSNVDKDLTVYADDIRITQIFNNLISNAIKFTDHGEVKFIIKQSFVEDRVYLNITVSDTGVGIAADQIERLFKPFVQLDQRNDISSLGTGLGLAITKDLVELMNGKIEVNSNLQSGTHINVLLPLKFIQRDSKIDLSRENNLDEELTFSNCKALVVDDNEINRKVLGLMLKKYNFDIHYANDGVEALKLIENDPSYGLVFLDVNMPGLSGIDVTKKIRSNKNLSICGLYIIGYSANTLNENEASHFFGMNAYLEKPVKKDDLYACLKTYKENLNL
ncbi:NMT1/THI5-like protein [Bacteriovorax sp. BSW11_IV]|uniref:ABC transporter substrate-binding protein n=1 Tax=Bacteriovorax sp. BSW11_IV TaxID=1353529 RepID=UPI000389FE31|nr:ABC transporter substrate-binding protein [Bacteriovorax sp. BSW11_IV]EQC50294.1 NMT1/THI5-like protein [Bacteriovorax sp. BSW11_IV]